mgnify:CR=1 FL=1
MSQTLPPPPDGSVNERQAIPPLRVVCGQGKVGGDLALLEAEPVVWDPQMIGAMACFVVNDSLVKYASETMPAMQLIFVRGLLAGAVKG